MFVLYRYLLNMSLMCNMAEQETKTILISMCGGQRAICSQFFPSIIWTLGIELGSLRSKAGRFLLPTEPSDQSRIGNFDSVPWFWFHLCCSSATYAWLS